MATFAPFRTEHIGTLLRPPQLLCARQDHAAGRLSRDELQAVEITAIRGAHPKGSVGAPHMA
jgi:5-methyltetrahydropteroyltriglutamate--homocysteine methyltransferase